MKRPMICIRETNGWEKETWYFWFDKPEKEILEGLKKLQKRFEKLGRVNQQIGITYYNVNFDCKEFDKINFKSDRCTYIRQHNFINGVVNLEKLERLISIEDNEEFFQEIYKSEFLKIFDREQKPEKMIIECPYCGGRATLRQNETYGYFYRCENCCKKIDL